MSDTTVMENQSVGTTVAKLIIEDEDVTNSYTYILYGPYNQGTSGFDSASFYVENDTLKTSVVFDWEVADTCYMLLELLDSYGNQLSRAFTVQIEPDQSGSTGISSIVEESDLLYPNPADRLVTLKNPESISSLEIFEIATGRKISMMRNLSGTVDVSGLPEGIYIVVVHSGKGVFLQKLLIQH